MHSQVTGGKQKDDDLEHSPDLPLMAMVPPDHVVLGENLLPVLEMVLVMISWRSTPKIILPATSMVTVICVIRKKGKGPPQTLPGAQQEGFRDLGVEFEEG